MFTPSPFCPTSDSAAEASLFTADSEAEALSSTPGSRRRLTEGKSLPCTSYTGAPWIISTPLRASSPSRRTKMLTASSLGPAFDSAPEAWLAIPSSRPRLTSGSRLPRRRYTGAPWIISMPLRACSPPKCTNSTKLTWGIAKRSPPLVTVNAGIIANVSGILILTVVPCPSLLCTSTVPPIFSTLVFTTSMPTPRPDTLVTFSAVENPGRKIKLIASRSLMRAACSEVITPRCNAFFFMRSGSTPAPSSEISMLTWPPSWNARRKTTPSAGLPAALRLSGASTPWSAEFRTKCVSGSLIASMMVLSSSVSFPSISMRIFLPQAVAKSRTTRGNLFQTLPMGCMRVFITPACNSVVIRFKRCEVATKFAS